MMATIAFSKVGDDISRKEPDLCTINKEDDDNYYGMWITGIGFFDVKFPKETTTELTEEEKERFTGKTIAINNNPPHHTFDKSDFE